MTADAPLSAPPVVLCFPHFLCTLTASTSGQNQLTSCLSPGKAGPRLLRLPPPSYPCSFCFAVTLSHVQPKLQPLTSRRFIYELNFVLI